MSKFTLYWKTGERNIVEGDDVASAMTVAGYGAGTLVALDFYARGECDEWEWIRDKQKWGRKSELEQDKSDDD